MCMYVHHVRRALKKADCLRLCYVQIELCLALADMLDFKQPWTWSDMTKEGGVFHFFLVNMQNNLFICCSDLEQIYGVRNESDRAVQSL